MLLEKDYRACRCKDNYCGNKCSIHMPGGAAWDWPLLFLEKLVCMIEGGAQARKHAMARRCS
jgi:hypothetical protein